MDPAEIIKSSIDIIAILRHVFVELSHRRREAIEPNLNKEFVALCSDKVPVTGNLFGDDLQTECNNIKTSNKWTQAPFTLRRCRHGPAEFYRHGKSLIWVRHGMFILDYRLCRATYV